ncbi:hypothetical protein [Butyrivibrio sp. FC2001]|uniref:hypothetical protein n=1 Tax=Butyrivibrio sp. FC2001 TaxID=1280671 RepID=UPI000425A4F1|nr:hypothetical protein [Butyrivibrio sp. FC2001]
MDLIYADVKDGTIKDLGILSNYFFDLSFGKSENDFSLTCPDGATRLYEDQVIYIEGTEFGGIIDHIEVDTASRKLVYSGRTWHGVLENKVLYPFANDDYLYYSGEANKVIAAMLERMNLTPGNGNELVRRPDAGVIKASTEDSGIIISGYRVSSEGGNYAKGYSLIRDMLYQYDAKPVIIDGVIKAVPLVDYSNDYDFLAQTDQFRAKRKYNSLNHLHCMGGGELSSRYTIDIYLDEGGGVLPYARENPIYDSDYYSDIGKLKESSNAEDKENYKTITENMVTGVNEIADIYDYKSAGVTDHYVIQMEKPSDWETYYPDEKLYGFMKYFVINEDKTDQNEAAYKETDDPGTAVRYDLLLSSPQDWAHVFTDYYQIENGKYEKLTKGDVYHTLTAIPSDWNVNFKKYYEKSGSSYVHPELVDTFTQLGSVPGDWEKCYGNYYYANGNRVQGVWQGEQYFYTQTQPPDWGINFSNYYYDYSTGTAIEKRSVSGNPRDDYVKMTIKPSDWKDNWKSYYKNKTVNKKTKKYPLSELYKKRPKWKANTFYRKDTVYDAPAWAPNKYYWKKSAGTYAPAFVSGSFYYATKAVPKWTSGKYYEKGEYPYFEVGKFYEAVTYQLFPTWTSGAFYTKVEDHYAALVEGALKKIAEYQEKDELGIELSDGREYDINDVVGASDEVTGLSAKARVVQKTVKIKRGITTISYDVG